MPDSTAYAQLFCKQTVQRYCAIHDRTAPSHVRLDSASVKILAHPCDRVWSGPCAMVGPPRPPPWRASWGPTRGHELPPAQSWRRSDWSSTPVRAMAASAGSGRPQPTSPSSTPATSRATTTEAARSAGWSATGCSTSPTSSRDGSTCARPGRAPGETRPAWATPWSSSPPSSSAP